MIQIVNVSPEDAPITGEHDYHLKINNRVMCSFKHDRQQNGLSQCLRDAADAFDQQDDKDMWEIASKLIHQHMKNFK